MATLNISMPDSMRKWIDALIDAGEYANARDYLHDLIRHDQRERGSGCTCDGPDLGDVCF